MADPAAPFESIDIARLPIGTRVGYSRAGLINIRPRKRDAVGTVTGFCTRSRMAGAPFRRVKWDHLKERQTLHVDFLAEQEVSA